MQQWRHLRHGPGRRSTHRFGRALSSGSPRTSRPALRCLRQHRVLMQCALPGYCEGESPLWLSEPSPFWGVVDFCCRSLGAHQNELARIARRHCNYGDPEGNARISQSRIGAHGRGKSDFGDFALPDGCFPRTSENWSPPHSPGGPTGCQLPEEVWDAHEFGEPVASALRSTVYFSRSKGAISPPELENCPLGEIRKRGTSAGERDTREK